MICGVVTVRVRVRLAQFAARAEKHPRRQREDADRRADLQIRLDTLGVPLIAKVQRTGGENPDDERVRNRRRQPEQHRLPDGSADGDNERGHHGFRVARLQPMQGSEQNGGGNEKPQIRGSVLQGVEKIRHRESVWW